MTASRIYMGLSIEKITEPGSIVAIDPKYRMRKDMYRVFIFPLNPFTCLEENKRIFISPVEAIILALCNGQRSIGEIIEEISYMLDCDRTQAEAIVINCLSKNKELLILVSDCNRHQIVKYMPNEFIIPRNLVDLTTVQPRLPEVIMFIPTFSCDFQCVYCYAPAKNGIKDRLDFMYIKDFLGQMREWRIPSLFLSGGDPFNFRMIKELLVGCLDLGIKPIIPTKTPLDQGMIDFIVNSNIDEMQFSVDTADGDLSRSLIGRGDNYLSRLFNTIQGMINKGVRIYTNTVVTSLNIGSLNVLIEKMIGLGVKQMTFSQYARSQFRHQDFLFCDQQKIEKLEQQLDHLRIKFPDVKLYFRHIKDHTILDHNEKEKFFKDIPECTAGKMGMVILPDGQVTVCENLYYQKDLILGDLKRQSLGEIWFSKRRSEIIEQGNKILAAGECLTCGKAIHCYQKKGKCFVRALQAFGDIRMPDPYCPGSTGGARIL